MEGVLAPAETDVVIIGAGPAGISTALFLAKKGIPSTLLDRANFPRDKICGDGLSGWVVKMLGQIGSDLPERLRQLPGQLPSYGIRVFSPQFGSCEIPYRNPAEPDQPPGHVIRRMDFDNFLFDQASNNPYINILQNIDIESLDTTATGMALNNRSGRLALTAKMVVVAAGAGSRIRLPFERPAAGRRCQAAGIRQYYSGISGFTQGNYVDFYFLPEILPGYLWLFPLPDGLTNAGLGMRSDILSRRRVNLKAVFEKAIAHHPELALRFGSASAVSGVEAWTLPLGPPKGRLSGDRVILAGDAARLVDPFTGEGIGNALWSGRAAAEHVAAALSSNRFDARFNNRYDRLVKEKFRHEFRKSSLLQALAGNQFLLNRSVEWISGNRWLRDRIIRWIA